MGFKHNYADWLKTIVIPGKELTRNPDTLKKLVDGKPLSITSWDTSSEEAPIMLADTGASDIIAVDFDGIEGDKWFMTAVEMDPDCKYIAKGIGKGGGHLIYREGNTPFLDSIITSPNGCKIGGLDLQRGRKLIFLATEGNATKQLVTPMLHSIEGLTQMPLSIQALITSVFLASQQREAVINNNNDSDIHKDSKLYYVVKDALATPDRYHHRFFTIVTTRSYKQILTADPRHPEMPFVPDNLPMTKSGNDYLVSIATILGRDPSIDLDTFNLAMSYVNGLFSQPMSKAAVDHICKYITSGASKINNVPVWCYNPEWQKTGLIYSDNQGASHEVFIYNNGGVNSFIDHNHITNEIESYNSSTGIVDSIKAISTYKINKDKLLSRSQKVAIISDPAKPFGIIRKEYGCDFNTYKRTEEQEILHNPQLHTGYQYPDVTIRFLENSMGKEKVHKFFLPFVKRKLVKREFSPLILVFYGPPHSGKSAVANGILRPFTKGRNITLSPEIITEKFDDWKLNKDIILIDEIHNTRSDYLKKIIQTINTISGSDTLTGIRAMQQSASSLEYYNTITIMVTCNSVVTLSTEPQDRRLVILRSFKTAADALGMTNDAIYSSIVAESRDFAYYLATEVEMLPKELYSSNGWLKDDEYMEFQSGALPFTTAISAAIDKANFEKMVDLLMDYKITLDDISRSTVVMDNMAQIRLYNSNSSDAVCPSLLDDLPIDHKVLVNQLRVINNTKVRIVDIYKGIRKNNKKTVALFHVADLPEYFRHKLNSVDAISTDIDLDAEEVKSN